MMVVVAGFGNPLLDVTVEVKDRTLLDKYHLNDDDQKEIPETDMKSLLSEINETKQSKSPGGCAQNTLRVLQWLLNKPNSTVMFGCIGNDSQGKTLKTLVENDGVRTKYIVHGSQPTGTSVALVNGHNRSLVAHLGAAEYLSIDDHLLNDLNSTDVIYVEGFFLTKRGETAENVLKYSQEHNKIIVFNLSATYMCGLEPQNVKRFSEECDILFGNKREYTALTELFKWNDTPESLAVNLVKNYTRNNSNYGKIVVITDGANKIFCSYGDGKTEEITVPVLENDKIKDTTGAGDSFVAGFLAGLFAGNDPAAASKWGCLTAQQIVQQIGCTIPPSELNFLC